MKKLACLAAVLLMALCCVFSAGAQENGESITEALYKQSGIYETKQALPEETQRLLKQSGISEMVPENTDTNMIFKTLASVAQGSMDEPIRCAVRMLGIIILTVLVQGIGEGLKNRLSDGTVNMVAGCAAAICLFEPLCSLAERASDAVGAASTFSLTFAPAYASILAASGQPATAAAFSTWTLAAGTLFSGLLKVVVVPACGILLGISVISACTSGFGLENAAQSVSKGIKWLLGIFAVIFTGVMSLKSVVASGSDGIGIKTAKFVISGFVPVIGSALGEAAQTVQSSLVAIKGGVGAFGIIAFAYIFIPVVTENIIWSGVMAICGFVSSLLGAKQMEKAFTAAGSVLGMLLAAELFSLAVITVSSASTLR